MGVYSGNRTLLAESNNDSICADHILEFAIETERNDLNMFNAVISCDLTEAYNEAGMISLTEAEVENAKEATKKGIVKKIKELFAKIVKKIKDFVATFVAKISNLTHNDMKLVKQYSESFKKNAVGYKFDSFRVLKANTFAGFEKELNSVLDIHKKAVDGIVDCNTTDEINTVVDDVHKKLKEYDFSTKIEDIFFGEKKEEYALTDADYKAIRETMGDSAKFIKRIKDFGNSTVKALKDAENNLKLEIKYNKINDRPDLMIASLNAQYKLCGAFANFMSKMTSSSCNAAARYLAACRRAFVVVGKKKSDAVEESTVYDYIVGEASDMYVEAALMRI